MSQYSNEERMKKIADNYFAAWNEHNLVRLRELFDEKITLKDWDIYETGIERVLKANSNIFEAVPSIKIHVIDVATAPTKIMAEIKVLLNEGKSIDVIDVLEVKNELIKSIKAFKC
tara:strand:+ start:260 stop:607 length:348 start_codon:yes stop_codon:yes gene_type:complete